MVHEIETQAIENIKTLLTNHEGPILGSWNERQDVKELIPTEWDLDADLNLNLPNSDHAPGIIENWVKQYNINTIYIVGFHYNLCVRGVYNACEVASKSLPQVHRNNFHAYIIEECTAALELDNDQVMTVSEYKDKGNKIHNVIKLKDVSR
jgi:hypothetical protein|tara:strand:- start:830 stop:1282 length:453 start_codon:yes stop_codon:yes gene_type:complete